MNAPPPRVVVYDDDCRFCTASARLAARADTQGQLRFVGSSARDELQACGVELPAGRPGSLLVRTADGDLVSESRAVAAVVEAVPVVGRPLAALLRSIRPIADPVYRFVARHRR